MSDAQSARIAVCPACGKPGRQVGLATVQGLLVPKYRSQVVPQTRRTGRSAASDLAQSMRAQRDYFFCDSPKCDTVYFTEDGATTFTKAQLRVPVGVKETSGERPLCYCFGHSIASIEEEFRTKGRTDALSDIRRKMNDPGCRCETENPSGLCCLGAVAQGIRIVEENFTQEKVSMLDQQQETDPCSRERSADRRHRITGIGALASIVIASSCCWVPLALVSVGLSTAGFSETLENHHATLATLAVACLALAFWFTCRKHPHASAVNDRDPANPIDDCDCCQPARQPSFATFSKIMLWLATGVVLVFAFTPDDLLALAGRFGRGSCCHSPPSDSDPGLDSGQQSAQAVETPTVTSEPGTKSTNPSPAALASQQAAALTVMSDDAQEIKSAFNSDPAAVKVLLLVSPRCPMCRQGAQVVQKALAQIESDKLKVYVVWIKRYRGDSRDAAQQAMELVPDRRARHFWDERGALGRQYAKLLELPGKRQFAWDVYFVFDPKLRWAESPPVPSFWMHQLGGGDDGRRLDGARFREAIRSRL